jgi:hypothetical protein
MSFFKLPGNDAFLLTVRFRLNDEEKVNTLTNCSPNVAAR